jgi:hypothetical protein
MALLLILAGKWSRALPDGLSKAGRDFIRPLQFNCKHSRASFAAMEHIERS